jgi:hypothetical protein
LCWALEPLPRHPRVTATYPRWEVESGFEARSSACSALGFGDGDRGDHPSLDDFRPCSSLGLACRTWGLAHYLLRSPQSASASGGQQGAPGEILVSGADSAILLSLRCNV